MTEDYPLEPAEAFAELGRIKLAETDLTGVLDKVSELAKRTIPEAAEVSVTLVRDRGAHTAAYTGELALDLDERQYERGRGPCLEASVSVDTLSLPDMSTESRWPDWAERSLSRGVHSSLSIGIPVHEAVSGALNIYAVKPSAFDETMRSSSRRPSPATRRSPWPMPMCTTPPPRWPSICRRRWSAVLSSSRPRASSWVSGAALPTRLSGSSPSSRRTPTAKSARSLPRW
jgi:hypothetical protein